MKKCGLFKKEDPMLPFDARTSVNQPATQEVQVYTQVVHTCKGELMATGITKQLLASSRTKLIADHKTEVHQGDGCPEISFDSSIGTVSETTGVF